MPLFIPEKVKLAHTESGIKCKNTESGHASLRANGANLCVAEQQFRHSYLIFHLTESVCSLLVSH